ncbi:MAG TPA: cytochrome c oxidase subunit II [Leptolyngbyaceae cyanobacterium M33_DOE_097]|uniref:Cytochrome c oxidase subunit 2 n=1 Tax=Oscillatoriales cyanobacterium SpSt-418 TaxID=2282169 RepID=A0A7C3KF78_9CYAN|nr:cytochrome c oxidase subunit II [Leptolyngbyaceae cyanobacterium M33_DOE_097]
MKIRTILTLVVLAIANAAISWWVGQQAYHWLPPQASAESKLVDELFSFLVTLGSFIFLCVTGAVLYTVAVHRVGRYDTSDGPPIEGNIPLEIVWTAIPIALVIWIAVYSQQIYEKMAVHGPMELVHLHNPIGIEAAYAAPMEAMSPPEEIEVHSRQWVWEFRYPGQDVTSTELHLPVDRRVKLALQTEDVIHGFYIPAFRLKQDIIPNKVIDFEFTPIREGKYRLRDSQYSGTYFAAMQTDVVVQSEADYQTWLAQAAKQTPVTAYNRAAAEYTRASEKRINAGWKTVPPAPAPIVNYAAEEGRA